MEKKGFSAVLRVGISLVLVLAGISQAVPTNGKFNGGLAPWVVENGIVTDGEGSGVALFLEDVDLQNSTLSQGFPMPLDAMTLSFDIHMISVPEGPGEPGHIPEGGRSPSSYEYDVFTACLLDPLTREPLTGPDDFFYYLDNTGAQEVNTTVEFDVSFLRGQDVLLWFNLFSYPNLKTMSVSIDNVNVSERGEVVPSPAALILGTIGAGIVGLLRRTKILR